MQTILRAIANGNLSMGTETIEHDSKSKKAMKEVCELKESLNAILKDSEKKLFEKLEDIQGDINGSDIQQSFINGFRLGALVMVEVFSERDSLVLGSEEE